MAADRRAFTEAQRRSLHALADGLCAECGEELGDAFHADHIVPHALGGATTIHNGQALCPSCNLRKGSTMKLDINHPAAAADREWQKNCLTAIGTIMTAGGNDFLASICPSAGKTYLGLDVARRAFVDGTANAVIILAPSKEIQGAWIEEAAKFGYLLLPAVDESTVKYGFSGDVRGAVLNYQWLRSSDNIDTLRDVIARGGVIVIADEIHHTADGSPWGDALKIAANPASFRLGLTGTPFRSDKNAIPFLHYDDGGKSIPHFEYTYEQALKDGIVTPVHFRWVNGVLVSENPDGTGSLSPEVWSFDKSANMDELERGRLLTTATSKGSPFLRDLLAEADSQLQKQREAEPADTPKGERAGGLVIAQGISAAQAAHDYITKTLGATAVIVHSDSPSAEKDIKAFRKSDTEWLVSVAMVSEGVNIPRLRVLAYATNERTQLAFIQAVGRVTRVIANRSVDDQPVIVCLPKLSDFEDYAEDIIEAVTHYIAVKSAANGTEPDAVDDSSNSLGGGASHGRTCSRCGHQNKPGARDCFVCGKTLSVVTVRDGRVIIEANGYGDGVTFGGVHYDEAMMDDVTLVCCVEFDHHKEFDRMGRIPWCVRRLNDLVEAGRYVNDQTVEEVLASVAAKAALKRAAQQPQPQPEPQEVVA